MNPKFLKNKHPLELLYFKLEGLTKNEFMEIQHSESQSNRLIWTIELKSGLKTEAIWNRKSFLQKGSILTENEAIHRIHLTHPVQLSAANFSFWFHFLKQEKWEQPFDQISRKFYSKHHEYVNENTHVEPLSLWLNHEKWEAFKLLFDNVSVIDNKKTILSLDLSNGYVMKFSVELIQKSIDKSWGLIIPDQEIMDALNYKMAYDDVIEVFQVGRDFTYYKNGQKIPNQDVPNVLFSESIKVFQDFIEPLLYVEHNGIKKPILRLDTNGYNSFTNVTVNQTNFRKEFLTEFIKSHGLADKTEFHCHILKVDSPFGLITISLLNGAVTHPKSALDGCTEIHKLISEYDDDSLVKFVEKDTMIPYIGTILLELFKEDESKVKVFFENLPDKSFC